MSEKFEDEEVGSPEQITEEQRKLGIDILDNLSQLAEQQEGPYRTLGYSHLAETDKGRYFYSGIGAEYGNQFNHGYVLMEGKDRGYTLSITRKWDEQQKRSVADLKCRAGKFFISDHGQVYGETHPAPISAEILKQANNILAKELEDPGWASRVGTDVDMLLKDPNTGKYYSDRGETEIQPPSYFR